MGRRRTWAGATERPRVRGNDAQIRIRPLLEPAVGKRNDWSVAVERNGLAYVLERTRCVQEMGENIRDGSGSTCPELLSNEQRNKKKADICVLLINFFPNENASFFTSIIIYKCWKATIWR